MATFPNYEGYGGATITRRIDGAGAEWIACCAKQGDRFGFHVFKNGIDVPLTPWCSGRGTIEDDGTWIAWEGNTYHTGAIPGWTPIAGGQNGGGAVAIPPDGALASLYIGVYQPTDFDTTQEIATRVQKQLDAIQELTELLKQAGVLV